MTLEEIEKEVNKLATIINAPPKSLPTYGYSKDFARPHIEIDKLKLYNLVIVERGQEFDRKITSILDELLYWVFAKVTFSMACNYELKNRNEAKDVRRIIFQKQLDLLGTLNKKWMKKEELEHQLILINHPYND